MGFSELQHSIVRKRGFKKSFQRGTKKTNENTIQKYCEEKLKISRKRKKKRAQNRDFVWFNYFASHKSMSLNAYSIRGKKRIFHSVVLFNCSTLQR